ncbi:unnamed protein product, partial [Mesorhabditis belari]|uniref:Uncharacterized protein n=1 Tax=Mesorhabditis belari TaxID=2138241 RepID=A0AAF3F3D1_9BILA
MAFSADNGTLFQLYDIFHPGMLDLYSNQCLSNPSLSLLQPNLMKGIIYEIIGVTYEILYLLCMIAMCQPKFLNIIAYRILFVIGCFDILGMIPNSLLPATWAVYSGLSISLAINRTIDFSWPNKQEALFGGRLIILWTGIPILYGLLLYSFLSPMLYHSPTASYYFGADPAKAQAPIIYPMNNGVMAFIILLLNIQMLRMMLIKNHTVMTKSQRVIMIQCLGISMSVLITGWLYVTMQFIAMPLFMINVANLCWQFSNGSMAIFYLLVNKSMRGEVLKLLRIPFNRQRVLPSLSDSRILYTLHSQSQPTV